jgi:NADH-ubiquinone oxidoreductase chain 2
MKRGVAPVHFWIPEITRKIKWIPLTLFLSIQKLAPLYIIISNSKYIFIRILIVLSSIIGTLIQLSSLNIIILLTYSSISHTSWIILAGILRNLLFFLYFFIYLLLLILIIHFLKTRFSTNILRKNINISLIINLLSFRGVPPLLGFLPKWIIVINGIEIVNIKRLIFIIILISCLNTFIYIRIFSLKSINTPFKKKEEKHSSVIFLSRAFLNIIPLPTLFLNII